MLRILLLLLLLPQFPSLWLNARPSYHLYLPIKNVGVFNHKQICSVCFAEILGGKYYYGIQ